MFVTNWISTTKIQKISEITNFFRHYFLSRTEVNDTIFERLDVTFNFEQAQQQSVAIKGANVTHEAVRQMLKNWKRQGLINILPDSRYQKVASTV